MTNFLSNELFRRSGSRKVLLPRMLCMIVRDMQFLSFRPSPPDAYDEAKAAQIAAFFALRRGGAIEVLALAKLMYLAERASYERYASPLTGDRLCSMEHGPVLSETLNHIRGVAEPSEVWQQYFGVREGNDLPLSDGSLREDDLLRLSEADVELLNDVWRDFGHMNSHQLWVYTHEHLPEYENPGDSSRPIKMNVLLATLGYSERDAHLILERFEEQKKFGAALKRSAV